MVIASTSRRVGSMRRSDGALSTLVIAGGINFK